jgi:hypothetical protein
VDLAESEDGSFDIAVELTGTGAVRSAVVPLVKKQSKSSLARFAQELRQEVARGCA